MLCQFGNCQKIRAKAAGYLLAYGSGLDRRRIWLCSAECVLNWAVKRIAELTRLPN